ncbi:hypothetical protein ACRAKI_20045 [Saccharothrix isguenensis]
MSVSRRGVRSTPVLPPVRAGRGLRASGRDVVVERVGEAVVVRPARRRDPALRELAGALPAVPASVVVTGRQVLDKVVDVVTAAAERGFGEVRLVGDEGFPDAAPAWWRRLAERADVTLLVPSGAVTLVGTTLFVAGGRGRWTRYAPGEADRALGPRHPEPRWQESPPPESSAVHGDLVVEHIPAGVLLRPGVSASGSEWHAVPPDPCRLTVVAGVPGGAPVRADDVAAYLATLPVEVAATARLVCGSGQEVVALGRAVAGMLGTAVTVVEGRPVVRDGRVEFLLHSAGRPAWTPFLQEIRCLAGGRSAVPLRWRAPHPDLSACGPGVFRVTDGWVVGVMRSGLWVRRADRAGFPVPVGAAVDPAVVVVAVGDPGEPLPDEVWTVVSVLLDRLDGAVLRRVRLSVLGVPGERGRAAAGELARSRGIGLRPLPG